MERIFFENDNKKCLTPPSTAGKKRSYPPPQTDENYCLPPPGNAQFDPEVFIAASLSSLNIWSNIFVKIYQGAGKFASSHRSE